MSQKGDYSSAVVVIADDDPLVRMVVGRSLGSLGVGTVLHAESGEALLDHLNDAIAPIDLIICDLKMPGMDGVEVIRHLSYRHSRAALVIASGMDSALLKTVQELARARGLRLLGTLPKPITRDALIGYLNRMHGTEMPRVARQMIPVEPADLARGLDADEIVLHFQPKVMLSDRAMAGVEALVRWQHPLHGLLGPDHFIPVAEEAGMMNKLTDVVLATAVAQCGSWLRAGWKTSVAVNMSVSSLSRLDLPERSASLLKAHGLMPEALTIEVTETGLVRDIATVYDVVSRVALLGVGLSIDDFGTGYSSMQQLVRLPFSEFKLDQSFVREAAADDRVRIVLETNIGMARRLGMRTIAEGVETEEHWTMLHDLGCDGAQGYWIGRPVPAEELLLWTGNWEERSRLAATAA